jgi:hypothetical protein
MQIVDMLNNVLAQSGFLKRGQFFNSADVDDVQMTAISNRVALEIGGFYPWGTLRIPFQIDLIEGQEDYDLPAGLKWIVSDSSWETDGSRPVDDHISDQMWYQYKFSSLTSGGTIRARQYGDKLQVQEPFAGGEISFEYVSEFLVTSTIGTPKPLFTEDSDLWVLDDQLLILGIQAHWMQTKLMPQYMEHMSNYRAKMNEAIGRDAVRNTVGGVGGRLRRDPYTKLWVN